MCIKSPVTYSWVYVRQYCAKIDEAARNRMELIMPELAKQYDVAEQLKAENQMEWVRQMNACKAQAEEVVKAELIYD
ncbi:TnpV protein [Bifidobacterium catenulatum]